MTITAVYPNLTSVKVDFAPIAAAKDYRIYETTNPMAVKYAGMVHLDADQLGGYSKLAFATDASGNPTYPLSVVNVGKYMAAHHIDVPVTEIELNGLAPGPHTLVVQAVDALGPAPAANLYDANNLPTMNAAAMSAMGGEGMDTMLGANAGTTPDGMDSTNGQGPSTDNPNVIAQSQPFTVTIPSGPAPIPSPGATAFFFDTFPSGTFAPAGANDVIKGNAAFTLTTPNGAWDVLESHCDIRDSRPFIMNSHYMAVDFDGQTPGSNEPLHVAYSGVGISAQKTAALAGNLLHATMEVDAHTDTRRWVGMLICDASDPLTAFDWEEGEAVNKGNTVLSVQWEAGNLMVAEVVNGHVTSITGPPGAAQHYAARWQSGWQFGHGLDNR
ncbi:MAG TPA: hypothetical protein VFW40_11550, partial [Capsulimonadaceae bacterium]|nr:hypothetical protein [Capsulimonadaceae bacterium]